MSVSTTTKRSGESCPEQGRSFSLQNSRNDFLTTLLKSSTCRIRKEVWVSFWLSSLKAREAFFGRSERASGSKNSTCRTFCNSLVGVFYGKHRLFLRCIYTHLSCSLKACCCGTTLSTICEDEILCVILELVQPMIKRQGADLILTRVLFRRLNVYVNLVLLIISN